MKETWGQELTERPWRTVAYLLTPHDLLNLLSYTPQDNMPRKETAYRGLGTATPIINQVNAPQMGI